MKTTKIGTMGQTTLNLEPLGNSDFQLFGSGVHMDHTKMDVLMAQHENHKISTMGQTTLNLEPFENSDFQLFG